MDASEFLVLSRAIGADPFEIVRKQNWINNLWAGALANDRAVAVDALCDLLAARDGNRPRREPRAKAGQSRIPSFEGCGGTLGVEGHGETMLPTPAGEALIA